MEELDSYYDKQDEINEKIDLLERYIFHKFKSIKRRKR